jgi:hypothetical protein
MKFRLDTQAAAMAAGVLIAALGFTTSAQAHKCNGRGTITIKQVANPHTQKAEYWYIQGGRVCGRFVA